LTFSNGVELTAKQFFGEGYVSDKRGQTAIALDDLHTLSIDSKSYKKFFNFYESKFNFIMNSLKKLEEEGNKIENTENLHILIYHFKLFTYNYEDIIFKENETNTNMIYILK